MNQKIYSEQALELAFIAGATALGDVLLNSTPGNRVDIIREAAKQFTADTEKLKSFLISKYELYRLTHQ